MFNNPLESFHDTVAEAKADREQLDRLLTVSSPRELLLLVFVFLVLVAFTVWLVFGVFDRNIAAKGTVIEHTPSPDRTKQIVRMDVWLSPDVGPAVKTGMPVVIQLAKSPGELANLKGDIQSILSLNLSQERIIASQAALMAKRFEIAVNPEVDVASYVGDECLVIIRLGRQSPLELLGETLL